MKRKEQNTIWRLWKNARTIGFCVKICGEAVNKTKNKQILVPTARPNNILPDILDNLTHSS